MAMFFAPACLSAASIPMRSLGVVSFVVQTMQKGGQRREPTSIIAKCKRYSMWPLSTITLATQQKCTDAPNEQTCGYLYES